MNEVHISTRGSERMQEVLARLPSMSCHEHIEDEQAQDLERREHRHDPDRGLNAEIAQDAHQEDASSRVDGPAIATGDADSKEGGQIDIHQSTKRRLAGRL